MTSRTEHSILDIRNGIAYLTVSNGTSLNILNAATIEDLIARLDELSQRNEVRALVLAGQGERAFVGGADIKEMSRMDPDGARAFITRLHALCERVREFPVPTIGRLRGWSIGAGMELAAACDIRIATTDAKFTMPEIRIGIPSVIHAAFFGEIIGQANAKWMLLTGATVDVERAEHWGFVTQVVVNSALDATIEETAAAIVECDSDGIRAQKELLKQWDSPHLIQAARNSVHLIAAMFASGKPQALMREFLERKRA